MDSSLQQLYSPTTSGIPREPETSTLQDGMKKMDPQQLTNIPIRPSDKSPGADKPKAMSPGTGIIGIPREPLVKFDGIDVEVGDTQSKIDPESAGLVLPVGQTSHLKFLFRKYDALQETQSRSLLQRKQWFALFELHFVPPVHIDATSGVPQAT